MRRRVEVHHDWAGRVPAAWEEWALLDGDIVARSRTTRTVRVTSDGVDLYLKRRVYPPGIAVRAALRHTFFGTARARREYENLVTLRQRAGEDAAPAPVAVGEARSLGLLKESFLATAAVPNCAPLSERLPKAPDAPERLGRFLARLHAAGFLHGSLFARNLISDGERFAVVDLDRSCFSRGERPLPLARRARDLACLDASVRGASPNHRMRVLRAYLGSPGRTGVREVLEAIERRREEAERRVARRLSPGVRTSPSSS